MGPEKIPHQSADRIQHTEYEQGGVNALFAATDAQQQEPTRTHQDDEGNGFSNIAHPDQHCPSMVVSPRGEVPAELPAGRVDVLRQVVDRDATSGWYLGQRRQDVIALTCR
jgi:hypothetical protein